MATKSGFVELAPTCATTPQMLYDWLNASQLVERVEWDSTQTERNIKVFPKQHSSGSATEQFIEFTVTRHGHMSQRAAWPYTVTVLFKEPPRHLVPHAWEILRLICDGKELFPEKVTEWMTDALKNHASAEPQEEKPSSASQTSNNQIMYGGSRNPKTRFRYKSPNTKAAFVELASTCVPTAENLYEWLDACNLVERVGWQETKTSQGYIGNHYSERNIKVFPKQQRAGSATQQFLEFQITRNAHMSDSVMFKEPPEHLVPHAWQILRDVYRGILRMVPCAGGKRH